MAYISQQDKARIATKIRPLLDKYGVKGTLSLRNHSTLVLTVTKGPIDFIGNFNACAQQRQVDHTPAQGHIQVNTYWCHEHFTGPAREFLIEALTALKSADWYEDSDSQTDYFNTAYYITINIGRWDKPYQLT